MGREEGLEMKASEWFDRGRYVSIQGHRVFVMDSDSHSEQDLPVLAILHGYPTSSHDYYRVLDALSEYFRVVIHDHLGLGHSDKPAAFSYALVEQTDVALEVWKQLGISSLHVFAHDYGTSIATELLARRERGICPVALESMVLCNGSVHIELAKLRPIQVLLRSRITGPIVAQLSSKGVFKRNMSKLWSNPALLSNDDLDVMWELLIGNGGRKVLPRITQYLSDRRLFWHRWVGALQTTDLPLGFVWGAEDPIVGADVARVHHEEAPGSQLAVLEGVGHYPMLEAPERWVQALLAMIDERIG